MIKIAVLVILFYTGAYGVKKPLATDEKNFIDLQKRHSEELQCLHRIDAIFVSEWMKDLKKLSLSDSDGVRTKRVFVMPSKQIYNTPEQEWLMESGSTSKEIEFCFRSIVTEIVPVMSDNEINCLNSVFARHILKEIDHESMHKKKLEIDAREQLPFRKYISFVEFVELMFQNRNPDALGIRERSVYQHAESFLSTENDKLEPTYIIQNGCSWKNAKALREAPNAEAKFNEFLRQVQDSMNQELGGKVLENWNLSETLPREKYLSWLDANKKIMSEILETVAKLRNETHDAQWLCDYAAQLSFNFSQQQSRILVNYAGEHRLEISEFVERVQNIGQSLDELHDVRYLVVKTLLNKYKNAARCLSAFYHLVENHQRFDIASTFSNERYTFPEFYCKNRILLLEDIRTNLCKCVGSFCVSHGIATLLRDEYDLLQKPDGTYYIAINEIGKERRLKEGGSQQEYHGYQ